MQRKYRVSLTEDQRHDLTNLISAGVGPVRRATHARILLKADESKAGPRWDDATIAKGLEVSCGTVARVRTRFSQEGMVSALEHRAPSASRPRRLDGAQEAHLIALTCGTAPAGSARWTLRLLATTMVALEYVGEVSYETVRRTLKKTNSNRG